MNRIAEEIKNQGRTIVWVAEKVGIPEKTFRNYTGNRNQPSIQTLKKVAEVLGVSMEELVD